MPGCQTSLSSLARCLTASRPAGLATAAWAALGNTVGGIAFATILRLVQVVGSRVGGERQFGQMWRSVR